MKILLTVLLIACSMSTFAREGNGLPDGYDEKVKRTFNSDVGIKDFVSKIEKSFETKCKLSFFGHTRGNTLWDGGRANAEYDCKENNMRLTIISFVKATNLDGDSLRPLRNVRHVDEVKVNFTIKKSIMRFKKSRVK